MKTTRALTFSLCFATALAFTSLQAQTPTKTKTTISFCVDAIDGPPYTFVNKDGFFQLVIKETASKLNFEAKFVFRPWKRCLNDLEIGAVDAIAGIVRTPINQNIGVFPLKGDDVDPDKKMAALDFFIFRKKGSALSWDGKTLSKLEGKMGVGGSYPGSIALLDQRGIPNDPSGMTTEANFQKLLAGRVGGVLGSDRDIPTMEKNEEYAKSIEVLEPPILRKYYVSEFSKQFYLKQKELCESIWTVAAEVAAHPDMQKKLKELQN